MNNAQKIRDCRHRVKAFIISPYGKVSKIGVLTLLVIVESNFHQKQFGILGTHADYRETLQDHALEG